MICSKCGAVIDDQSRFCDLCGAHAGVQDNTQPVNVVCPVQGKIIEEKKPPFSGFCITGFVLPFLWLGFIGLPLSILGIVDCNKNDKRGKGLGIAGLILNILNILGYIIVAVFLYFFMLGLRPS